MSHCLLCGEQVPEGTCTCPRPVLVPSLAPEALVAHMFEIRAEVARLSAEAGALYDRAWDVENGPALGSDEYTAIMDEWHTVMQERFALLAKLTVVRDQYRQALEEPAP